MARTVDENRAANEAFSSMHRSSVTSGTSVTRPAAPSSLRSFPSSVKSGHSHIVPTPGNPVPMDLDATRRASNVPLCFRCKKPGHYGRDCPTRYDVREMTIDELEEALEIRLAQLDVTPSDPLDPVAPSSPEQKQEESKDF